MLESCQHNLREEIHPREALVLGPFLNGRLLFAHAGGHDIELFSGFRRLDAAYAPPHFVGVEHTAFVD